MSEPINAQTTGSEPGRTRWQDRRLMGVSLPVIALALITIGAAVLRFYNLGAIGDANVYYTAAIKSMLQSWHNFFFVVAEPGGSVTIDKPPLGLWLQAASALVFGVNGFAVMLPEILSGLASILLLYHLVKRYFGTAAGLIAALALAITPVAVAVERNNTMDASLIFVLLLAAWAFIKATDTGRLRWLLVGGVLVGLGVNIKMMQAFLPLPAFYALYLLGAKTGWLRKIGYLTATTVVLLVVSLSWAVAVDLTPASQRPYVGSSSNNTEMNLILGYNGTQRLFGGIGSGAGRTATSTDGTNQQPPAFAAGQGVPPQLGAGDGQPPAFPGGDDGGRQAGGGGGMFGGEIGQASALRLFTTPLANEIGWLLPVGLVSIALLVVAARPRLPLDTPHLGVVLWGGWLITEIVFFSVAGFFHAYYLAMLAPPLAALVGIGVMQLWRIGSQRRTLAAFILVVVGGATLGYQAWVAGQYVTSVWWLTPGAVLVVIGSVLILARIGGARRSLMAGFACVVVAILVAPAVWSGLTTLQSSVNNVQPHAYTGQNAQMAGGPGGFGGPGGAGGPGLSSGSVDNFRLARPNAIIQGGGGPGMGGGSVDADLLSYLQANTQGVRYMMAVSSSMQGDAYVLATGRPVLFMGGFNGNDKVIDAAGLQKLVDVGELKYVLWGGSSGPGGGGPNGGGNSSISAWLQSSCTAVTGVTSSGGTLYQCAGQ